MIRTLRALFAVAVISAPFVMGSAANAQVCTGLDPTCIAEETLDTVGDALDDPVGAADDARGGAQEAADNAVNTVKGRADDVVATVRETVDGIVDPGGNPPPGGGGGGGSDPGNGGGTDGPATDPSHARAPQHHGAVPGRAGGSPRTTSTTGGTAATDPRSVGPPASDIEPRPADAGAGPTIAPVAAVVISGVMALLLGAVTVFLTLQERLDKRDPKLVLASLGSDRVQFT